MDKNLNRSILKESFRVELSYNENILMRRHFYTRNAIVIFFILKFLYLYISTCMYDVYIYAWSAHIQRMIYTARDI